MRILQVIPTYLPAVRYGGPIFAVHGLCRSLASRGHKVEVVTTNADGLKNSSVPVGVPIKLDGVQVTYFSSDFLRRFTWTPSLARALRGKVDGYDLIHLHTVFLWPTWAVAHLARKDSVPYLISPRGMLVKKLTEQRSRFAKAAWINLIERSNLERAAAIHVTSELEGAELMRFKWRLPRVAMIPNGVEEVTSVAGGEPSREVTEIVLNQPLVLFLGRISWKKGLTRLLHAFALTGLGKLAVVGTDDEGLVPELHLLAQKLQIRDRIQFLPRTVTGCDKELLFAAARVFVLPSHSENFGNTVLEAMQRSVPVVVTPEVGAAEIVRAARGGIVTQGDPKSLSAAISRLINDPALARNLGEGGRRFVREHYTWSHVAARMEALYESVKLANRASPNSS